MTILPSRPAPHIDEVQDEAWNKVLERDQTIGSWIKNADLKV